MVFGETVYDSGYVLLECTFTYVFLYKLKICLQYHCFMQNCTSMICYKKMRPTVFHTFLNLVGVWEDFTTELYAHPPPPPPPPPPYLHSFLDFTFEEVVGVEEPVHWEAPLKGNLDSEVPRVKKLS